MSDQEDPPVQGDPDNKLGDREFYSHEYGTSFEYWAQAIQSSEPNKLYNENAVAPPKDNKADNRTTVAKNDMNDQTPHIGQIYIMNKSPQGGLIQSRFTGVLIMKLKNSYKLLTLASPSFEGLHSGYFLLQKNDEGQYKGVYQINISKDKITKFGKFVAFEVTKIQGEDSEKPIKQLIPVDVGKLLREEDEDLDVYGYPIQLIDSECKELKPNHKLVEDIG